MLIQRNSTAHLFGEAAMRHDAHDVVKEVGEVMWRAQATSQQRVDSGVGQYGLDPLHSSGAGCVHHQRCQRAALRRVKDIRVDKGRHGGFDLVA